MDKIKLLALLLFLAALASMPLVTAAGDKKDNKKEPGKDKKVSPLEQLGKKLKEQIAATAPPAWKARQDIYGDPLPTGVTGRLGSARFRHGASITAIAYSPDGKWLATGGADNKIRLFDAESGKEVGTLAGHQGSTFVLPAKPGLADFGSPTGSGGWVTALAFSPDSKSLASGGWDDMVRIWDPSTGQQIRRLDAHQSNVSAIAFSSDGKRLATRGGLDGVVRVWDPATGKEIQRWEGFSRRSAALAITPDNQNVVIGGGKAIYFKDIDTGKETRQLAHANTACLAFSRDGKTFASGGRDSTLRLWDADKWAELRQCVLPRKEPPTQVAFSPDGKHLAAAVRETNALVFDVATGKATQNLAYYWPDVVAYAPDGKSVAFAGDPSAVRIWDPTTGKELAAEFAGHQSAVTHVVTSSDGKTVVSGGDNLRIWDADAGKLVRQIAMPGRYVEALALSADGKLLATGGRDKMVRVWDAGKGKEILSYKHEGTLRAVALSPDGRWLASGDLQLNFRIFDLDAKKEAHKINIKATFTDRLALAFSPDSKTLACGGALNADWPKGIPSTDPYGIVPVLDKGYPVLLWDVASGKETGKLYGPYSRIRSLSYSPDGKLLAAASSDGRICLWDAATNKEKLSFLAHPENVDSSFRSSPGLAFGPDNQTLASAGADRTIRLWDLSTGKERGELPTPSRAFCVSWSKDGRTLATGHADSSVYVWDHSFLALSRPLGKRNFSIGHIDLR
jgi:WD40 repeat protein